MVIQLLGDVGVAEANVWRRAGPAKRSAVLAVLALNPNQTVPQDVLVHRVWGSQAPPSVRSALYAHVARLRKLVEPLPGTTIDKGEVGGYRLSIPEDDVDVFRMRAAVVRARGLVEQSQDEAASRQWREAVDTWQGTALRGIEGGWAQRTRAALHDERLTALEGLFDAELTCGRHGRIVDELTTAVNEHPHSEGLAVRLITALYRCGRQADALARYAETVQRLREELGVEPGERLRATQRAILRQDPELDGANPQVQVTVAAVTAPRQLPPAPAGFVGRRVDVNRLTKLLETRDEPDDRGHRAVDAFVIAGMAGVGKTSLALVWAHEVAERFGDGQLFCDLRGFDGRGPRDTGDVLAELLGALGVPAKELPQGLDALSSRYRSLTAGKRLLVVADNAASAAQVRPLLPSGPGSVLLVTSRNRLSGLLATHGARRVELDVLSRESARRLLAESLGEAVLRAEPEATGELIDLCGRLPLALRITAANLADGVRPRLRDYVDELSRRGGLAQLAVESDAAVAVRPAFDLSFDDLDPAAQRVFRSLSLLPGTTFTAAAVTAADPDLGDGAVTALRGLVAAHLVTPITDGRYTLHDLLRQYAHERATEDLDDLRRQRIRESLFRWYIQLGHAADRLWHPANPRLRLPDEWPAPAEQPTDRDAAMDWLDCEFDNIAEVILTVESPLHWVAWRLADVLRGYLVARVEHPQWPSILDTSLARARESGDHAAIASVRQLHGTYAGLNMEYPRSLDHHRSALEAARLAADREREVSVLTNLANTAARAGLLHEALEYSSRSITATEDLGRPASHTSLSIHGFICVLLGRLNEGSRYLERASRIPDTNERATLGNLGLAYLELGRLDEGVRYARKALELCRRDRAQNLIVTTLGILSELLVLRGDDDEAMELCREAAAILDTMDSHADRAGTLAAFALANLRSHPAAAVEYATEAVRLNENEIIPFGMFEARLALVQAHAHNGDFAEALRHADELARTTRQHGYRNCEGKALTITARIQWESGDAGAAAATAHRALARNRETGNRLAEAYALWVLSQARPGAGKYGEQAEKLFTAAGVAFRGIRRRR